MSVDTELLKTVFERARDQFDAASRWGVIIPILLLAFHVLSVGPYLDAVKKLSEVKYTKSNLLDMERRIGSVSETLDHIRKEAQSKFSVSIEQTLVSMKNAFRALSQTVETIQGRKEPVASRRGSDDLQGREFNPAIQTQVPTRQPRVNNPDASTAFKLNDELIAQIRRTNDNWQLRDMLKATVEAQIIEPHFEQLNKAWRENVFPIIQREIDSAIHEIDGALALPSGERPLSDELKTIVSGAKTTVLQVRKVAEEMTFTPPADPFWWTTLQGKELVLFKLGREAQQELEKSDQIQPLIAKIEAAARHQGDLEKGLKAELQKIEKAFEDQKAKVSAFGQTLEVVPVELKTVVCNFPLLIGLVLAGIQVWQVRRLAELFRVAQLVANGDSESRLKAWLLLRVCQSGSETPQSVLLRNIFFIGAVAITWIAVAAWQLWQWSDIARSSLAIATGVSLLILISSMIYRWRVASNMATQLYRDAT